MDTITKASGITASLSRELALGETDVLYLTLQMQ